MLEHSVALTTRKGLRFLGHSTVRLELAGSVVLTDPVLADRVGPLLRVGPSPVPADWAGADLVLLSHLHGDHTHLPSLRLLCAAGATVVAPRGAGGWLRARSVTRVVELAPGEVLAHRELLITGVPAVHSGHRWGPRSRRGPQAAAMGHLIEGDDLLIYAAGDTDLFDGMAGLPRPDVALLPVWGWGLSLGPGHLDPDRAAVAVARLRPRVAVPVHWGTFALAGLVRAPGPHGLRMRRLLVEPPHRFAAAVVAAGGSTEVPVIPPGQVVPLPGLAPQ